jgi:hypothetical protein
LPHRVPARLAHDIADKKKFHSQEINGERIAGKPRVTWRTYTWRGKLGGRRKAGFLCRNYLKEKNLYRVLSRRS